MSILVYPIRRLFLSWQATIGLLLILFWVLAAIFAPAIAPYSPQLSFDLFVPPLSTAEQSGTFHLLGTDGLGQDILSRLIYGARTIVFWAPLATLIALVLGTAFGLIGGYMRGLVDELLSFIANLIFAFPVVIIYSIIITTIGASPFNIVFAVAFVSGPAVYRIVRGEVIRILGQSFIDAAKTRGERPTYILVSEILPNVAGPLIVDSCLRIGYTIITIGILGFIGLGFPPPTPDWGSMVNEARPYATLAPYIMLIPCIAISSLVLGLNLFADGLKYIMEQPHD